MDALDQCESEMLALPPAHCPVQEYFIPGFYIRQIFMPAGSLIASKIHKTRHPYSITQGVVSVWIDGKVTVLEAPHVGITEPGTRRLLFVQEDCVWTTFHANPGDGQDVAAIEERIIEPHVNEALGLSHAELQNFCRIIHQPKELQQ